MGKESPGLDGGEPAGGGVAFVLFGADVPDFRIAGLGVQDDEAADGGVGLMPMPSGKSRRMSRLRLWSGQEA